MPPYSWTLWEFFNLADNQTLRSIKDLSYWKYSMRIVSKMAESRGFHATKNELENDMEEIFNFEWKLLKVL